MLKLLLSIYHLDKCPDLGALAGKIHDDVPFSLVGGREGAGNFVRVFTAARV